MREFEIDFRITAFALQFFALIAASSLMTAAGQTAPGQRTVAITFDDIPIVTSLEGKDREALAVKTNRKILTALKRRRAPAMGFVNEGQLANASISILGSWNRGDFELTNHGFSHADANTLDLAGIEREIL